MWCVVLVYKGTRRTSGGGQDIGSFRFLLACLLRVFNLDQRHLFVGSCHEIPRSRRYGCRRKPPPSYCSTQFLSRSDNALLCQILMTGDEETPSTTIWPGHYLGHLANIEERDNIISYMLYNGPSCSVDARSLSECLSGKVGENADIRSLRTPCQRILHAGPGPQLRVQPQCLSCQRANAPPVFSAHSTSPRNQGCESMVLSQENSTNTIFPSG